jgi:DNA (cytosine-5)-methyltransferase 1
MNATKTEIAQHVTLITPSAIVLDRIKKMNMSTAKTLTETLLPVGLRKLTPTECERLQGFPDGYTDIMPETPDGPRYKALGNSMAVPVMRWIGERINEHS